MKIRDANFHFTVIYINVNIIDSSLRSFKNLQLHLDFSLVLFVKQLMQNVAKECKPLENHWSSKQQEL